MARVSRRKFLKVSSAGALAAKAGGMAGILASSRAPAYAQTATVQVDIMPGHAINSFDPDSALGSSIAVLSRTAPQDLTPSDTAGR